MVVNCSASVGDEGFVLNDSGFWHTSICKAQEAENAADSAIRHAFELELIPH